MSRVRIGTCSGLPEVALVRAAFAAHEIPVLINAEQHASMLGGLGGDFVPLIIFVDEQYAEEAAALLRDLREQDRTDAAEDGSDAPPDDEPDDELDAVAAARTERRRRVGIMLLVSVAGLVALPFALDAPLLGVLLAVAFAGLMWTAMRKPAAPRKQPLPRARVANEMKRDR